MSKKIKRSPLFYVGDKYRLMKQLLDLFPAKVDNFYEPFSGGGTVFLNVEANKYFLNDIDRHLANIHKLLIFNAKNPKKVFDDVDDIIHTYRLSHSYKKDIVPDSLKKEFKKTYYAKFNKDGYEKLRLQRKTLENSLIKENFPKMILFILIRHTSSHQASIINYGVKKKKPIYLM